VTAQVTEGQWPKMSVDMEKCATPVTKIKQFNLFVPLTDALKPPSTAASNRIDLNDAMPTMKTRDFSDHRTWS